MSDDEPLVTEFMIGCMVAFGADILLFVGLLWIGGVFSTAFFVTTTALVVGFYLAWIGARWLLRRRDSAEDDPAPIETLKERYAAGELSEAEFERRVESLADATERVEGAESVAVPDQPVEPDDGLDEESIERST